MGNNISFCDEVSEKPVQEEQKKDTNENIDTSTNEKEDNNTTTNEDISEDISEDDDNEAPNKYIGWNAPIDKRFPSANQARACFTRYSEYYKCKAEKDETDPECMFYKRCYKCICPIDWIDRWEEQRAEGTWPGKY